MTNFMTNMKLKTFRYFGSFYEYEGQLGWMPFWRVAFVKLTAPNEVLWVKQNKVKIVVE